MEAMGRVDKLTRSGMSKEASFNLIKQEAENGNSDSQLVLAQVYDFGDLVGLTKEDRTKAFYWYKKSAEQGNPSAQYALCCCYQSGIGTPKNMEESYKWCLRAAEQGRTGAMYRAAQMAYSKDPSLSFRYFSILATVHNNSSAQLDLGRMYYEGVGVPVDKDEAFTWINMAARNGDSYAKQLLEELF